MPRTKKPDIEPIIGRKINKLTILEFCRLDNGVKGVICKCDCGNVVKKNYYSVKSQYTTSCGCNYRLNLTGQRFGKLIVLECYSNGQKTVANCICDCGNYRTCDATVLTSKRVSCCGCNNGDKKRRIKYLNRQLYEVWKGMKARCRDENHVGYKIYGGRGVRVCEEWEKSFLPFYEWCMKNGWEPGKQIDKDIIPKKLGLPGLLYSPEMCCIVDRITNARNSRQTKLTLEQAIEIRNSNLSTKELCKKYNIGKSTIEKIKKNQIWKM